MADLFAIPDDGWRHELIDGVHHESPAPGVRHQLVITELITSVGEHVHVHRTGTVVSYTGVILDTHTVVLPDLLFISTARASIIHTYVEGAPDLMAEVLTASSREYDERVKYRVYESAGVLEYWIIDPESESAKVFRRSGNKFAPVPVLDIITTPLLPNFQLRIAGLFA